MMKKKFTYHSTLLFVASLLAGFGAIEEFAISSAAAEPDCNVEFEDVQWFGKGDENTDGINAGGRAHCQIPYPNSITLTIELWNKVFNPATGKNEDHLQCTDNRTVTQTFENTVYFLCPHTSRGDLVNVKGIITGYDRNAQMYSIEQETGWVTAK